MKTPINNGLAQSDIDMAGFDLLNFDGGGVSGATHPVFTRLPAGVLIKGVGISHRPADTANGTFFGGSWGGGGQTFAQSYIENQLDLAPTVGANTILLFGDLPFLIDDTLSLVNYLARVEQIISYADDLGLYVVFNGSHGFYQTGTTSGGVITAEARQFLKDTYNSVRAHNNVIAFNAVTEASLWNPSITDPQKVTAMQTIYADLKGESTDIPITFGGVQTNFVSNAMWSPVSIRTSVNDYMDYLDFHCYYSPTFAEVIVALAEAAGRPIIVGEFGSPTTSNPDLGDGCDYAEMLKVAQRSPIDGYIAWTTNDQDTNPNNCWGMMDTDGTLRSGRGTVFVNFPATLFAPRSQSIPVGGTTGQSLKKLSNADYDVGWA